MKINAHIDHDSIVKFLFPTILFIVLPVSAWSQNVIAGKVIDSLTNQPIDCVSVILERGEVSKAAITDSTGIFSVAWADSLKPEKVTFEHVAYKTKEIGIASNDVGVIYLSSKSTELSEIVVKPNWISRKDGNVIIDVTQIPGYDKLQTDKILKRLPGVFKMRGGGYTLNGKNTVIYINGIKQNISIASLEAFLSCLPATAISEVKLVNLNTGEYPAEIGAVIDIKIDPRFRLGYSLQPYITSSFSPHGLMDYGGSVFYLTKVKKILFHTDLSVYNERSYSKSSDSLYYLGRKLFENQGGSHGRTDVIKYQASMTYTRNNDHTLSVNFITYNDFGKPESEWNSLTNSRLYRSEERSDLWNGAISYNIPYKQSKSFYGTMFYALSYGGRHSNNKYYEADDTMYDNSDLDMEGWMHTLAFNFNSQWKILKLFYGAEINYNCVWDRSKYESSPENNSSPFRGHEILPSAYSILRIKLSKSAAFRIGARMESTNYQYGTDGGKENKNYVDIFPSFIFDLDKNNYYLTAGIVSNIDRPNYENMLPSVHKVNDNYYTYGNPTIKPSRAYGLHINNTFFKYFYFNLSYILFKDEMGNVYEPKADILMRSVSNMSDAQEFRINTVIPFMAFGKKLTGQVQTNLAYTRFYNFKNGYQPPVGRKTRSWIHWYTANINYDDDRISASLYGSYNPNRTHMMGKSKWNTNFDVELSYSLLKERNLILGLDIDNLFSHSSFSRSYFLNDYYSRTSKYTGPIVQLSIKFRLNKGQKVTEEYHEYTPDVSRLR